MLPFGGSALAIRPSIALPYKRLRQLYAHSLLLGAFALEDGNCGAQDTENV